MIRWVFSCDRLPRRPIPKIHQKETVLEGKGVILSYSKSPHVYYYRELIPGTKTYRTKKIEGVDNIEDGKKKVLDIYSEFRGRPPSTPSTQRSLDKKLRTQSIEQSVENFLQHLHEKQDSGIITWGTYRKKRSVLINHLIPYLKGKGITKTRQIDDDTFTDYLIYRKNKTKLTIHNDITVIKNFLSEWLLKKRLIEPEVVMNKKLFPMVRIQMSDLMSNPPITDRDWKTINTEIRRWVKESTNNPNHRSHLWRTVFWTFTLIMKNGGFRPEELMKLRWNQIEIVDVGRISETMKQEEIEDLRSEGIEIEDDGTIDDGGWVDSTKTIGREQRLISYITVKSGKTGSIREVPTNSGSVFVRFKDYLNRYYRDHYSNREVKGNDLVFGNINNECKPYSYSMYGLYWSTIIGRVKDKLEGNKFTDENYTIYSMRSTFITNKLTEGLDIFLLSRITGHDVKVLIKHYERMDIRKRSEEITKIDYGKRRKDQPVINLFDN
ncbi:MULTISPECIES: tyrosine-type recombinase/integrase [Prochlorococcus]|uniref:tyrosine-type recombinase/integrase n=1 Tax=Prochlorococcus TaxID=1218 RepID=UPI0007B3570C|nr:MULTISPECIES: site-specific integrase [Prochlorococcus]KZR66444.1 Phage integrase family protein [Prochlorococcus marinus str. MIT 1312]KZR83384.1 Phage integrase family protein [Prochlorococcus marinus str. MIT 1327]NMO83159.1 site-specific integrase [Prochlorococcus sp. P1344]NMP06161.1 site-specific integrase [Prochlorococcus sp. P1361]NMP12300.1 site-specific integrase [Prochlorococcus sp.P1363]